MNKKIVKKEKGELSKGESVLSSALALNIREVVLKKAEEELRGLKEGEKKNLEVGSFAFKGMTLREFEVGTLLDRVVDKEFGVIATEILRRVQEEYGCNAHDKKILAEMIALNYSRVMATQKKINNYLELGTVSDLGVRYLAVMSKELDRAQRHLTTSIQMLMTLNQPPINVSVKAGVANIANQQVVKNENVIEAK